MLDNLLKFEKYLQGRSWTLSSMIDIYSHGELSKELNFLALSQLKAQRDEVNQIISHYRILVKVIKERLEQDAVPT